MAVLFRAHAHSLELELELTARKIPFAVRAGTRFLEQAHIKDVIAHLRWTVHPADELAALRVLRLQPGLGATTAGRLVAALVAGPVASLGECLAGLAAGMGVAPRARAALDDLQARLGRIDPAGPAAPAIRAVVEGPYREHVLREYANADARLEDLAQLAEVAERYDALPAFLDEVAFMAGLAAESVRPGDPPDDRLTLSTVHQAKGLEWRVVFLISLTEGQFPAAPALQDPWGEEEERRLFHVALTRARDQLVLTHPLMAQDRTDRRRLARASRFLTEVDDPALLERWRVELE
jgi:DNA helicase-2/ATP-dependent DNA helicase PcrA